MKKRIVYGLILLILIMFFEAFVYLQYSRHSQIVTSYKSSHGNTSSVILNVNANKLFLSNQDVYDILYGTCTNYANTARCDKITIYLYANRYSFLHGQVHCMGEWKSNDTLKYNTKDNPEEFWLEILPAPW